MIKIKILPMWQFQRSMDGQSLEMTLDILSEIRATRKITAAAASAGMSYRHVWNLIEKWGEFFGQPLVESRQGSGTTLTPFGEKLVWAGERLEARLRPLLQNLSQELQTEVNQMLDSGPTVLRVHASHGFAVPKLRELLMQSPEIDVDFRYVGNQYSLVSLAQDGCDLAGMHLPRGDLRAGSIRLAKGWLNESEHRVISFVSREMGLMVAKGNPLGITGVSSLPDPKIRFVNRDPASGTRLLFEQFLAQHQIEPQTITGYSTAEFTHAAVAAYVASGLADVAFGVEAAARQFGLDFLRLLTEDYVFVCPRQILETPAMQRVLTVMRSPEFHEAISALPGYQTHAPGRIRTIREVFRSSE